MHAASSYKFPYGFLGNLGRRKCRACDFFCDRAHTALMPRLSRLVVDTQLPTHRPPRPSVPMGNRMHHQPQADRAPPAHPIIIDQREPPQCLVHARDCLRRRAWHPTAVIRERADPVGVRISHDLGPSDANVGRPQAAHWQNRQRATGFKKAARHHVGPRQTRAKRVRFAHAALRPRPTNSSARGTGPTSACWLALAHSRRAAL